MNYSHHLNSIDFITEGTNFIFRNLTLILTKDYFGTSTNQAAGTLIVSQAWSLQIELLFYLIAPFILLIKNNFIGFAAFYFIMFYGFIEPLQKVSHYYLISIFMMYFVFFLLGICAYKYIYKKIENKASKSWVILAYYLLILYMLFYQYLPFKILDRGLNQSFIFYILFSFFIHYIFQYFKKNKIDRFIGELSYPVYILHFIFAKILFSFHILITSFPEKPVAFKIAISFNFCMMVMFKIL